MQFKHETTYNNRPVTVVAGFDPMLHRFWAIVEPKDELNPDADDESGLIYSNLDDQEATDEVTKPNLDYFRDKFKSMGIAVPDEFFAKVFAAND